MHVQRFILHHTPSSQSFCGFPPFWRKVYCHVFWRIYISTITTLHNVFLPFIHSILLEPNFIPLEQTKWMFKDLESHIPWEEKHVKVQGTPVRFTFTWLVQPRMSTLILTSNFHVTISVLMQISVDHVCSIPFFSVSSIKNVSVKGDSSLPFFVPCLLRRLWFTVRGNKAKYDWLGVYFERFWENCYVHSCCLYKQKTFKSWIVIS